MKNSATALVCAWLAWALVCFGLALLPPFIFFGVAMLSGIPIFFALLGLSMWSLIVSLRSVSQKRWLMATNFLFLAFAVPLAVYRAIPYVQYPQDYMHFLAMRPIYDATVARLPKNGHRFAEFNWGGMLFASKGVVYDETDEVRLPSGHQSVEWKRRMKNTDLTCGSDGPVGEVVPLGNHYYVASFGC